MAGANLIYGLGMIEMGMTIDYGQLVMDNEFARMIKHSLGVVPVSDATRGVDIIKEVGVGKDFLSHEHNSKNMKINPQSKLIDRKIRETWMAEGSTDIHQRAMEQVRYILENHKPDPLPDTVTDTLRGIVEEAEKELGISK